MAEGPILVREALTDGDVFSASRITASLLARSGGAAHGLHALMLLLDHAKSSELDEGMRGVLNELCREAGLFPYIVDDDEVSISSRLAFEAHRAPALGDLVLHREQANVLLRLLEGRSVVLSAPTSFGKSLLIDILIANRRPKVVAAVFPTLALVNEARRRFTRRFGADYQIVTQPSQTFHPDRPRLYVMTQERLLQVKGEATFDLLVIDEFYKLDPERRDERSNLLNLLLYLLSKRTKQFFLLGPYVENIKIGRLSERFEFFRTDAATVHVEVVDRSDAPDKEGEVASLLREYAGEQTLIFCGSVASAQRLAAYLVSDDELGLDHEQVTNADWLSENYNEQWSLVRSLRRGIGIHHARIPRSVAALQVREFNERRLPVLICTSTLMEGVNTAAKNVIIYEMDVNNRPLDFFSFANIRGRAGRMRQHFIGRVFVLRKEPEPEFVDVDIPIFTDPDHAEAQILLHVDDSDLGPAGIKRKQEIGGTTQLSLDVLREFPAVKVETLNEMAAEVGRFQVRHLTWRGWPRYPELAAALAVAWPMLRGNRSEVRSARQLQMYLGDLSNATVVADYIQKRAERDATQLGLSASVDNALLFFRFCEFSVAQALMVAETVVNDVLSLSGEKRANYSAYANAVENWFRSAISKELEEYGLPLPLQDRLRDRLPLAEGLNTALAALRTGVQTGAFSDLHPVDQAFLRFAADLD